MSEENSGAYRHSQQYAEMQQGCRYEDDSKSEQAEYAKAYFTDYCGPNSNPNEVVIHQDFRVDFKNFT